MERFYDYQMKEIVEPWAVARLSRVVADLSDAVAKLEALGTADQIRDYLVQEQVFGRIGKTSLCVLARYFQRQTHAHIDVTGMQAWVAGVAGSEVPLPTELRILVGRFDRCQYPELDERHKSRG